MKSSNAGRKPFPNRVSGPLVPPPPPPTCTITLEACPSLYNEPGFDGLDNAGTYYSYNILAELDQEGACMCLAVGPLKASVLVLDCPRPLRRRVLHKPDIGDSLRLAARWHRESLLADVALGRARRAPAASTPTDRRGARGAADHGLRLLVE